MNTFPCHWGAFHNIHSLRTFFYKMKIAFLFLNIKTIHIHVANSCNAKKYKEENTSQPKSHDLAAATVNIFVNISQTVSMNVDAYVKYVILYKWNPTISGGLWHAFLFLLAIDCSKSINLGFHHIYLFVNLFYLHHFYSLHHISLYGCGILYSPGLLLTAI